MPSQGFTDAAALLDAVAKTYAADAPTFHFESITETSENGDLRRDWQKSFHTAIKGPGNRFRIEVKSWEGTWTQASDGVTEWTYLSEAKMYVKRAASIAPDFPKTGGMGIMELKNTWEMRAYLDADVEHAKGATMFPDETITVEGHSYPCYVVHAISERSGWHADWTFWIEKKTLVFRKTVDHQDTYMMFSPILNIPLHEDVTTVYPVAELQTPDAPELFAFTPPFDAKEVAALEPGMPGFKVPAPQGVGKQAPDIALPDADGKEVKLASFRGRPLLIDIWATWCAPCLEWMPSLGRLEKEMRGSGLQVISVDEDQKAASAAHYLSDHGFTWPNFHDGDGRLAKALGENRIPLTLLIDAEGRIVYAGVNSDEAALRKAIAGLGSQVAAATH